jgi:toxin ParE1/3/4
MIPRVLVEPIVRQDIARVACYIAKDNCEAAERFIDAASHSFRFLARQPYLGEQCRLGSLKLQGVRAWQVKGFENYLIFYQPLEDGVLIIRVLHAARDIAGIFGEKR